MPSWKQGRALDWSAVPRGFGGAGTSSGAAMTPADPFSHHSPLCWVLIPAAHSVCEKGEEGRPAAPSPFSRPMLWALESNTDWT